MLANFVYVHDMKYQEINQNTGMILFHTCLHFIIYINKYQFLIIEDRARKDFTLHTFMSLLLDFI